MRLTIGTLLGSTNARITISNLPTHFLLMMYRRHARPVWSKSHRVFVPLTKVQHRAIHELLRLRFTKRGSVAEV